MTVASSAVQTSPGPGLAPTDSDPQSAYVRSLEEQLEHKEEKLEHHRKVIRLYQNLSSLAIHVKKGSRGGGRDEAAAAAAAGEGEEDDEVCLRQTVYSSIPRDRHLLT